MKFRKMGKKGQIDIAIVVGSIIVPVSALIGAIMFAWLLISPTADLCKMAETISYDIIALSDVAYSVPDDLTIMYKGPPTCVFLSYDEFPRIIQMIESTEAKPEGLTEPGNWYYGYLEFYPEILLVVETTISGAYLVSVDVNGNGIFGEDEDYASLYVGDSFTVDSMRYTIQPHSVVEGRLDKVILTKTALYKTVRNVMACMNRNLLIDDVFLETEIYQTLYPIISMSAEQIGNSPFPFFSKSSIRATILDPPTRESIPFNFNFRSYANSNDFEKYSMDTHFYIDDNIFISKYRTPYYDTISTYNTERDFAIRIAEGAYLACKNEGATEVSSMNLPPQYWLKKDSNKLIIFWTPSNNIDSINELVNFDFNELNGFGDCTYELSGVQDQSGGPLPGDTLGDAYDFSNFNAIINYDSASKKVTITIIQG